MVRNPTTDPVIVSRPPNAFPLDRPTPHDTIHNVYELRSQPELIRYHHALAGFPTKPTWIVAIKNKHFASWPGLTIDAARKHFPDSIEVHKGHGRKTPSGLRSKKTLVTPRLDDRDNSFGTKQAPTPP
jgi:hypothetical protein